MAKRTKAEVGTSDAPVSRTRPLADELRPDEWELFCGLSQIDANLIKQIRSGQGKAPSIILWGPPGSGKTTFARLMGRSFAASYRFVELSAVLSGVKDVRDVVEESRDQPTILFIDEIHRFNKAQQDAFLPHVEKGTITLVGATTENPSFYLTSPLLSRMRVIVLPKLSDESLRNIMKRAEERLSVSFSPEAEEIVCGLAMGDARRLLNMMEAFVEASRDRSSVSTVMREEIERFLSEAHLVFYDREGEEHYNTVSAFIKSMRGSNPDAALFWGFRMIEAGEDPRFVIRRMIIFASEDIGNADPRALQLAVATLQAYECVGLPEGKIPIAHCITYLACAPKSNRSYLAMHKAIAAIGRYPAAEVPLHLRNAPTGLMKSLGYGKEYQYPHDFEGGHVKGVQYLPDQLKNSIFYEPSDRGLEIKIGEALKARRGKGGSDSA